MTTNVYDQPDRTVATDSRWSISYGKWVLYVDDSQFHKIERYKGVAFMFAGDGAEIQQWKNWISAQPVSLDDLPTPNAISVCMIKEASGDVLFVDKKAFTREGGYFAGSGALHAHACWHKNRNAVRSVETAKTQDQFTGGETKFLNCATGAHNLSYPSAGMTIEQVNEAVLNRGMVMENTNLKQAPPLNAPFSLKDAAATNPEFAKAAELIVNGALSVRAPYAGMDEGWTDQEKADLKTAMKSAFDWAN
ncbi:MAG: hypothetical protein RJA98_3970 [Pseudomonadota bacterium]|jgi:hypothetical protein